MEGSPYSSYTPLPEKMPGTPPRKHHRTLWIVLIVLVILVAGGIFFVNRTPANAAALVNGQIITKDDIAKRVAQVVSLYSAQGVVVEDPDLLSELKDQAVQTAITDKLLLDEATRMGITVDQSEVDKEYNDLTSGDEADITQALTSEGLTVDDLKSSLKEQMIIGNLAAAYAEAHGVTATEGDIMDLYHQLQKDGTATSTYDEMANDLRTRVIKQKTDALMTNYVNDLRSKAKIKIYSY